MEQSDLTIALALVVTCLLLGALFSLLDHGLSWLTPLRLKAIRDAGGKNSATAEKILTRYEKLRGRVFIGRVLFPLMAVTLGASMAVHHLEHWELLLIVVVSGLGYAVAMEATRTLVLRRVVTPILVLSKALRPVEVVLAPLAWPLLWAAKNTWAEDSSPEVASEESPEENTRIAELEVEHFLDEAEHNGTIPADYAQLLKSVMEFKNTVAREVMVPRSRMVAIELSMPLDQVLELVIETRHSRYPVYRERVDQIEGVLYAKDLFSAIQDMDTLTESSLLQLIRKPVFFSPEKRKIGSLLREMQARHVHLAVVIDEFGGTSGLVTLEDILEEIVGEIQDEHDTEELRIQEHSQHRYVIDAGVSIFDIEQELKGCLRDQPGPSDSLGGLIIELLGRVPSTGESIDTPDFRLTVLEADERRVIRVEAQRHETQRHETQRHETQGHETQRHETQGHETQRRGESHQEEPRNSTGVDPTIEHASEESLANQPNVAPVRVDPDGHAKGRSEQRMHRGFVPPNPH